MNDGMMNTLTTSQLSAVGEAEKLTGAVPYVLLVFVLNCARAVHLAVGDGDIRSATLKYKIKLLHSTIPARTASTA